MHVSVHMCTPQDTCARQRTTCESWFSPATWSQRGNSGCHGRHTHSPAEPSKTASPFAVAQHKAGPLSQASLTHFVCAPTLVSSAPRKQGLHLHPGLPPMYLTEETGPGALGFQKLPERGGGGDNSNRSQSLYQQQWADPRPTSGTRWLTGTQAHVHLQSPWGGSSDGIEAPPLLQSEAMEAHM